MRGTGFADFSVIVSHCCWPLPVGPSEGHSLIISVMDMWDELWHLVEAATTVVQHVPGIFQHTRNSCNMRAQLWIQRNGEHFQ